MQHHLYLDALVDPATDTVEIIFSVGDPHVVRISIESARTLRDHLDLKLKPRVLRDARSKTNIEEKRTMAENERPIIVCLCGSTRFYDEYQFANYLETLAGRIVLSVGFFAHHGMQVHGAQLTCTKDQKVDLDILHLRKIDLADEVLIINVDGYIGESTAREIVYAERQGKPMRWYALEEDRTALLLPGAVKRIETERAWLLIPDPDSPPPQ